MRFRSGSIWIPVLAGFMFSCGGADPTAYRSQGPPNIVIIYVDDLGYADVESYGAVGVQTPHINELDRMGIRFQDAHSSAATCTPSRYTLLTGSYAFRNDARILPGDAPLLITPGTPTLPGMLKEEGYRTAVIGKWHLGLGDGQLDWNGEIRPGPLEIGFDYCYLIPATGDRVPCVWVENRRVVGLDPDDPIQVSYQEKVGDLPTGVTHSGLLKQQADPQHSQTIINGISRIGYMSGGESAWWKDEEFPDILTGKAKAFITENRDRPFFLYFSFHDIHVPRVVNPRFEGASTMGPRGDAIAQMDWCTGQIMEILDELGLREQTLIIFTSDNGPVLNDGYMDRAVEMAGVHRPPGPFRGGKYSNFEAGTRVPTIVSWPGTIEPGISDALIGQVDLYASIAQLLGHPLKEGEAPDSWALLETWTGKDPEGREYLVEEALSLSLRTGEWKYISPLEGGSPAWMDEIKRIESGASELPQLYHLGEDLGEQHNLAEIYPERTKSMAETLKQIIENK